MPIPDRTRVGPALLLAGLIGLAALPSRPAVALDAVVRVGPPRPVEEFETPKQALRTAMRSYNAGDKAAAVRALEYAATQGDALALWKLGRMYAEGDGIPRDSVKAYECFSRIADDNADEPTDSPRAGVVASAFVALGSYIVDGIKGTEVLPNPERAAELFQYAASYFGDPNAQYSLAKLYIDGTGVERDLRQAARWLNLAAEKGHSSAQALLGQMLIDGQGVPKQRARGLMWLNLAKQAADPKREAWISALHAEAFSSASETDKRTAEGFTEQFRAKRR